MYLAAVQNLEREHVMSYPMTMAPLSLTHIDGAMHRTDKSSLMTKLEKKLIKSGILDKRNVNVCLIDFIYLLPILPPQLPTTFDEVATFITKHACLYVDTVHIFCDAYCNEPTITDSKRDRRGIAEATYSIQ